MNKILLASLVGAAFAADAAATAFDFSYAASIDGYFGSQKIETYDVAIFLPGDVFEGMKITAINGPIAAGRGINNYETPSVWLSSELKLENKKNAPDIASYDASIIEDSENKTAVITQELPEAYTITADGVYVGYSFKAKAMDAGTKYPVAITANGCKNSFFIHGTKSVTSWTDEYAETGYGCAISVVLEAENLPTQNVALVNLSESTFMSLGEPKSIPVTLASTASEPVSSVDFEITINGATTEYHYDLPEEVPAGINKTFTAQVIIPAQDQKMLNETAVIKVAKVNGVANESNANSAEILISVFEVAPVHQALYEEYTGTWCGWCVRGYAALEHIAKNYPDYVLAAYHNGDAMTITSSYPVSVSGFPSASLDRAVVCDPYYGTETYDGILPVLGDIEAINSQPTPWIIEISHTWDYDNILTANVDVTNVFGYEGTYKIGYLLVCDGLSNESWSQGNYYYSYPPSSSYIEELNNFCSGGVYGKSSVKDLVFNDVVISINGYKGVSNSMPASAEAGEKISHTLSWDLNKIKAGLLPDKNKLRIIAFVLDKAGKSLNCAKEYITDFVATGIDGDLSGSYVNCISDENASVEYYNVNGVKIKEPTEGIYIRKQGDKTEKVVIR